MTPRLSHEVKLVDGSIGVVQRRNPDGTWRVWVDQRKWKGKPEQVDRFGVAKVDVKESEMVEI